MLQRIRHVLESDSFEKLSGEVEMDEAYIGGSDKNKHHNKKLKTLTGKGAQGHGSKNSKAPVSAWLNAVVSSKQLQRKTQAVIRS
jgi:hypothetical protein